MFKKLRPFTILGLMAALMAAPALAQSDVFNVELRPGWRMQSGNQMAAVHLRLEDGWKTYWRAPGDSGIPPSFNWSGSQNLKSVRFHWPRPYVYDVGGFKTIGYKHELILPLEVEARDPSKPVWLKASVDLGVCSDICVPASFRFEVELPSPGASDEVIRKALRKRPSTSREAGVTRITCSLAPLQDGLRVTAQIDLPSTGGAETVVFEPGQPGVWVSEADVTRQGNRLTATADMVGPNGGGFALQRNAVMVTVLGKRRAVEIKGCPSG